MRSAEGKAMLASCLRLDFGWRRGPSGTRAAFMKHWTGGWKSLETWPGGMREQSGQTKLSELWQLSSREEREDDGRKKGGGAEAAHRDQRCTHQGLVSPSLWQGQRGGEGWGQVNVDEDRGSYNKTKEGRVIHLAVALSLYIPLDSIWAQLAAAAIFSISFIFHALFRKLYAFVM